jgi:ADP-ribose pyrophosphatase YjhB (NUDIX family)
MKFSFCPKCAGKLVKKILYKEGNKKRLVCSKCSFIFYQNSKPTASAIIVKNNKVLLARRAVAPFKNKWDSPGGFLEEGEAPEAGTLREIKEELGVKIKITRLIGIYMDTYGNTGEQTLNIYYEAKITKGTLRPASDVKELKWFSKNKLPKLAFKNQNKIIKIWRKMKRRKSCP